jgi:UDP-N-acetylmuramate--alanine ligase
MNIYFSGIGGVAIGPLSEIAADAGYEVQGSDQNPSLVTERLTKRGIQLAIGAQDGSFLQKCHDDTPIDWFVYTAALPADHPELVLAKQLGIKTAKRDELIAHIIKEKNLKLIAISGTHGKTTTTGMIIWLANYFSLPISYSVGTTLSWGPSGRYTPGSEYFVYECDEFDRNFLHFNPFVSIVTSLEYDHPDTYPTEDDYEAAFKQFSRQSEKLFTWREYESIFGSDTHVRYVDSITPSLRIHGEHNRRNASLILAALESFGLPAKYAVDGLNTFPGTDRRFERLSDNLYTDYGHTPSEIAATLQMAREVSDRVALVYQPHQNVRQHKIKDEYTEEVFKNADRIYWLPTYLSREDPQLPVLTPDELTTQLSQEKLHIAEFNDGLWQAINAHRSEGFLVLVMGAGAVDSWTRQRLQS